MKPQKVNMNNQLFAIKLLMVCLVIVVWLITPICYATDPEDLPWSNESDIIILPWSNETEILPGPPFTPPLPPFFSDFNITPTEIQIGDDLIISFVIENPNNHSITRMSTTRIGDFFTQIIEIELEAYESKIIWYRIIPHTAGEYDVWIDGMTGVFNVTSPTPEPDPLEELREELTLVFNILDNVVAELIVGADDMDSRMDVLETHSNDTNERITQLENEISRLENTIMYAFIATAVILTTCIAFFIKKARA